MAIKVISHKDRLSDEKYIKKCNIITREHVIYVKELIFDKFTGRFTSKLVRTVKRYGNLHKFKINDFSIEALRASGAITNLTSTFAQHDNFTTIANLTTQAENIINSQNQ